MKQLITILFFLSFVQFASADVTSQVTREEQQSDGTTLTLQLVGDENLHYYATLDGYPCLKLDNGDWAYALLQSHHLVATTRRSHNPSERPASEQLFTASLTTRKDIAIEWQNRLDEANSHRLSRAEKTRELMATQRKAKAPAAQKISRKGLILLVEFQDVKMNEKSTLELFDQMANGIGNPLGKNTGSVREFFRDQSYGQLDIVFDIVGPYTLPHEMAYYGGNVNGQDGNPRQMVVDGLLLAAKDVDFSKYDWNGDGNVEQVYIIYAGYSESSGGPAESVWPHESSLASPMSFNGAMVKTYACSSELAGSMGTNLAGIGAPCHEFSHCLGLPDFYDTEYNGHYGMGIWSIMSSGSHNGGGYHPVGFTAYERWFCGWLAPISLNERTRVQDMPAIEDEPVAYIVYNDATTMEYYLLANHQQKGWDVYNVAHGMMVMHISYDGASWRTNKVNAYDLQRVTVIPADGTFASGNEASDLWPGPGQKRALTDTSIPAATLTWANTDGSKLMHKPIEDIREENGMISFQFMGGIYLPVPKPTATAMRNSFIITWPSVDEAVSYNLEWHEKVNGPKTPDEALLLLEDFSLLTTTDGKDKSSNVDADINEYTLMPGWTADAVYPGKIGAKIGKSTGGSLITPLLETPLNNAATVYLKADRFGSDNNLMDIIVLSESNQQLNNVNVSVAGNTMAVTFQNVKQAFKIKIQPKKRVYLCYLAVFDGVFTKSSIETAGFIPTGNAESATPRMNVPKKVPPVTHRVQGITSTTYNVKEVEYGQSYQYRLQAVNAQGIKSDWSEEFEVTVNGTGDGVRDMNVECASATSVATEYFDLSGRRLSALPARGIIVVKQGKVARKVVR